MPENTPQPPSPEPVVRPLLGEAEYAAAMAVRTVVFVEEQGFPPHEEFDRWDAAATHFGVWAGNGVVGTARLFERYPGVGKLGRVALRRECRGRGWGRLLVAAVVRHADQIGLPEVIADAQVQLLPFYESFGFIAEGEPFDEGGFTHRRIRRQLLCLTPGEVERSG